MCAQGVLGERGDDFGVWGTRYEDVARGARQRRQRNDTGDAASPTIPSSRLVPPCSSAARFIFSTSSTAGGFVSSLNLKSPTSGA